MKGKKNIERQRVVLAALLHDIGKFWQRADDKWDKSENISKYYKPKNESYDITVPLYQSGAPKYVHALWTNAFFEETKTGNKSNLNFIEDDTLANLSANHHKPNNHNEAIIAVADRWSSGIDRPDEGEEGVSGYKEVINKFGNDFVRKVAMHSIFDTIGRESKDFENNNHTYPIASLELQDNVLFPTKRNTINLQKDYKNLWDGFLEEYIKLVNKVKDFNSFYLSLLTLLKKYTWCIPSATNLLPSNVSLYEHLKSTAAIAISLYDYCEENMCEISVNEYNNIVNIPKRDTLLMVCVDVSGIQKFIYDIANKKAAASLKGRSFFIEILIQNIIDEILENKSILAYRSNVIYSSGGKAYMILPNTDKVKNALEIIQNNVEKNLFNGTDGQLFVSIGYTSFRYESTYGETSDGKRMFVNKLLTDEKLVRDRYETNEDEFNLSMLWRSVSDKANDRKNKKFRSIYLDNFEELFLKGKDFNQDTEKCSVTGKRIKGEVCYLDENQIGEKKIPVSKIVYDQVELGKDLRESKTITHHLDGKFNTFSLGTNFSLDKRYAVENAKRIFLNEWPNFDNFKGGNSHMFYGGNYQPSIENRSKTFEELCEIDNGIVAKLAILRMDVDNLGQIFINGITNKTFASYATLSMMLDTFFAGYINTIQQQNKIFKEHIQILYSGGDDIFAVGRWDAIIDFAAEIREAFRKFVCRDDISISAGISIVNAKYPISKAAQDAGEAETRAKNCKNEKGDLVKDAIDVFGQTIAWGKEWGEVVNLRKQFEFFEPELGRALIHSIQNYKIRKDESFKSKLIGKQEDLSYIWQSGYQLTRMMNRLDKKKDAQDFVKVIRNRMLHDEKFGSRFLDLAAVAARWAEYRLKDYNK